MMEDIEIEVDRIVQNIRNQFYTEVPVKKFFQDRDALIYAITWPATWLKGRGVTWSAERYFRKLVELLQEIKRHGATGQIEYFPGYLLKVFQDHFAHNSDQYCDEGKRTRSAFEMAIGRAVNAASLGDHRQAEAAVDVLAQTNRVLAAGRRRRKHPSSPDDQMPLL